ncbi:MAG: helix-turn-helix domain-containing protein [Armatimonadota bacterium]
MDIDFTTREGRRVQGQLIQQASEQAGFTLEALAREIECSRALLYQYVSGVTLAQPDRLQQIARKTGKTLAYFYSGIDGAPVTTGERIAALQTVLAAQASPPDLPAALATCEQLIALARTDGNIRAETTARVKHPGLLLQRGEYERALQSIEQSLSFFIEHNLTAHQRAAEQNRGHALLVMGRIDEAEASFRRVVAFGDWESRWHGLVSLAGVAEHRGEYRQALALLDEALGLQDMAPQARAAQTLELYVRGTTANIQLACGDIGMAAEEARRAYDLALELANRDQSLEAMLTLGVCLRWQGKFVESRDLLEQAARLARLSADQGRETLARAELARTLCDAGRFEESRRKAKEALQQAIAIGSRRGELAAQLALADGGRQAGPLKEARYHAVQAVELTTLIHQPAARADALVILGQIYAALDQRAEAVSTLMQAAELAESLGTRGFLVLAHAGLARLDEPADGPALLAHARAINTPPTLWRGLLASGLCHEKSGDTPAAEAMYQEAIAVIDRLRGDLRTDSAGDTLLECPDIQLPYLNLAQSYYRRHAQTEIDALQAGVDWPPLAAKLREVCR